MTQKTESTPLLSRAECNFMRGLAILVIVLNNFGHWIEGVHVDNEYTYDYGNVVGFMNSLAAPNHIFPFELLSFYSPFGVMLFIFLSGYGLTLKYENGSRRSVSGMEFVTEHYKKLFTMQAKGLALFVVVASLFAKDFYLRALPFLCQLLMLGNLTPHSPINPGPYWFFGMIMEVYVVYRLLFYRRSSLLMMSVVALSIVLMAFMEPTGIYLRYLRMNLCLALLPFSLGVLVARHCGREQMRLFDGKWRCWMWLLLSVVLLTLCKFNFYAWLFMPIFIVSTSIALIKILGANALLTQVFTWLGGLSGVMFVVHPALRMILIERANEGGHFYSIVLLYLFLTLVLSVVLKPVFVAKK